MFGLTFSPITNCKLIATTVRESVRLGNGSLVALSLHYPLPVAYRMLFGCIFCGDLEIEKTREITLFIYVSDCGR